jgi:anti-repressor protein
MKVTQLQLIDEREVLGKQFKIYGTPEEPLFLAKDVAEWIEHSNPTSMLADVEED